MTFSPPNHKHNLSVYLDPIMATLEKAMAPHSSVLALRIPGTGEPGGLPSMGSHTTEVT